MPEPQLTLQDRLSEDVPLPGSVSGRRIIRLDIAPQDLQKEFPLSDLFVSLGFQKSSQGWRYNRAKALEWFLAELRSLADTKKYSWVQDPWIVETPAGQPTQPPRDAGPRPGDRPSPADRPLPRTTAGPQVVAR